MAGRRAPGAWVLPEVELDQGQPCVCCVPGCPCLACRESRGFPTPSPPGTGWTFIQGPLFLFPWDSPGSVPLDCLLAGRLLASPMDLLGLASKRVGLINSQGPFWVQMAQVYQPGFPRPGWKWGGWRSNLERCQSVGCYPSQWECHPHQAEGSLTPGSSSVSQSHDVPRSLGGLTQFSLCKPDPESNSG